MQLMHNCWRVLVSKSELLLQLSSSAPYEWIDHNASSGGGDGMIRFQLPFCNMEAKTPKPSYHFSCIQHHPVTFHIHKMASCDLCENNWVGPHR
jgi:hypothetical protein